MADERKKALAAWYLHAGHRALWRLPLSIGLAFCLILLLLRGFTSDPRANAIKSAAEFAAFKRTVPDDRNAFIALRDARKNLIVWHYGEHPIHRLNLNKDVLLESHVEKYWEDSQPVLAEIRAALLKPDADNQYDWKKQSPVNGLIAYRDVRDTASLLALDAQMHAPRGNHKKAAESLAAIHRLYEHVARDPALISLMVACASDEIAHESLAWILTTQPLDESALVHYAGALRQHGNKYEQMARCFEFERAYALSEIDAAALNGLLPARPGKGSPAVSGSLLYGADRETAERTYNDIIDSFRKRTIPPDVQTLLKRHQRGPSILSNMLMPSIHRSHRFAFQIEENVSLLEAAIAVCRYQQKYGRDPSTLERLVPEFLPRVPRSAHGDDALRLRTLEQWPEHINISLFYMDPDDMKANPRMRLLLYTNGPNRIDEQGRNDGNRGATNDDITLLLRTAEPRKDAKK